MGGDKELVAQLEVTNSVRCSEDKPVSASSNSTAEENRMMSSARLISFKKRVDTGQTERMPSGESRGDGACVEDGGLERCKNVIPDSEKTGRAKNNTVLPGVPCSVGKNKYSVDGIAGKKLKDGKSAVLRVEGKNPASGKAGLTNFGLTSTVRNMSFALAPDLRGRNILQPPRNLLISPLSPPIFFCGMLYNT